MSSSNLLKSIISMLSTCNFQGTPQAGVLRPSTIEELRRLSNEGRPITAQDLYEALLMIDSDNLVARYSQVKTRISESRDFDEK